MAQALGRLLSERGECVAAIASRDPAHAAVAARFVGGATRAVTYDGIVQHARYVLIAVPDDAIAEVAQALAQSGMCGGVALHTSGARGPEALAALAASGVSCGTLHPLQTVANPGEGVTVLPGSAFAIDGEPDAVAWATQIAGLLNGIVLQIPATARPLYHAAAVTASNYLIALISTAVMLMKEAGVDEATAQRALEPLARTSVRNAFELGPAAALTGPIVRGDADTVRAHLAAIRNAKPAVSSLYRAVGLATLEVARRQGLDAARGGTIEEILMEGSGRD